MKQFHYFLLAALFLAFDAAAFLRRRYISSHFVDVARIAMVNDKIGSDVRPIDRIQTVTFVSSNKNKIKEVEMILGKEFPWKLDIHAVDLMEPQATPIEVSRHKCKQAVELCKGPVIVEDTSLCFNALNGLPGPYIKWFYESIGNTGLVRMLDGFEDKSGYAQCVLSFCMGPGHEVLSFVGSTEGDIVEVTGPEGFGWDPIFKPSGSEKTFAQMSREEKNKISHRYRAFRELKYHFTSRIGS